MSQADETCINFTGINEEELEDPSDTLRIVAIVLLVLSLIIFPSFLIYFLVHRNSYEALKKRTVTMMVVLTMGTMALTIQDCVRNIVGNANYDCHVFHIVGFAGFSFIFSAYLLRFASLYWRISFNKRIINLRFKQLESRGIRLGSAITIHDIQEQNSVYTNDGSEGLSGCLPRIKSLILRVVCWKGNASVPKQLRFAHFLSSKFNTCLIFYVSQPILMVLHAFFLFHFGIPINLSCKGCTNNREFDFFYPILAIYILTYFLVLHKLKQFPDSLGVKKEIYLFGGILFFLIFVLNPLFLFTLSDIDDKGLFDFALLNFPLYVAMLFYSMPYQVIKAKRTVKPTTPQTTMAEFLKSEEATKIFLLYLSARLSPETLLFYTAVDEWKDQYDFVDKASRQNRAQEIYDVFIDNGSIFKINISGSISIFIRDSIEVDLKKNIFDEARFKVYLMMQDFFTDFVKSSYFSAVKSDLDEDILKNMGKPGSLLTRF